MRDNPTRDFGDYLDLFRERVAICIGAGQHTAQGMTFPGRLRAEEIALEEVLKAHYEDLMGAAR